MEIHLFDNYYLRSDQYQFWVAEKKAETGKSQWSRKSGYYIHADAALNDFRQRAVKASECQTLTQALGEAKRLQQELKTALRCVDKALGT